MKKTILIILITVVVTSLLWLVVAKASGNDATSKYFVDYEQSIIGKWVPVEEADFDLEFTKYGIMKWRVGVFEDTFEAKLLSKVVLPVQGAPAIIIPEKFLLSERKSRNSSAAFSK